MTGLADRMDAVVASANADVIYHIGHTFFAVTWFKSAIIVVFVGAVAAAVAGWFIKR